MRRRFEVRVIATQRRGEVGACRARSLDQLHRAKPPLSAHCLDSTYEPARAARAGSPSSARTWRAPSAPRPTGWLGRPGARGGDTSEGLPAIELEAVRQANHQQCERVDRAEGRNRPRPRGSRVGRGRQVVAQACSAPTGSRELAATSATGRPRESRKGCSSDGMLRRRW